VIVKHVPLIVNADLLEVLLISSGYYSFTSYS
jgi:hypothetical protein